MYKTIIVAIMISIFLNKNSMSQDLNITHSELNAISTDPDLAPLSKCYDTEFSEIQDAWHTAAEQYPDRMKGLYYVISSSGGYLAALKDIHETCSKWYTESHTSVAAPKDAAVAYMWQYIGLMMVTMHRSFYSACLAKEKEPGWEEIYLYCNDMLKLETKIISEYESGDGESR